jgi:hypothetical protein
VLVPGAQQSFCFGGSPFCKRAQNKTPFYLLSGRDKHNKRELQIKQITIALRKPPLAALWQASL